MRFFNEILYLLLFLNFIATEGFVEFEFDAISLGHSGLLIFWKPKNTTERVTTSTPYVFQFEKYIVGEKNDSSSRQEDESYKESESEVHCSAEQYKIHFLNENEYYEVIIKQYEYLHLSQVFVKKYSVRMRTNLKSTGPPAKPYFEFISKIENHPNGFIRWYPCGRERICHDRESGTYFGVSIKEVYSTRKLNEAIMDEFYSANIPIFFYTGRIYEVVVYSVNAEYKTYSDSQQLFFKPNFPPVQYVNVVSLPDLSVLISWEPPKQSPYGPIQGYHVSHSNSGKFESLVHTETFTSTLIDTSPFERQYRIVNLIPESTYTYIILPFNSVGVGFEYQIDYKLRIYNDDLPIAKPDFNYILIERSHQNCILQFQWLPCGKSLECNNTKPGSEFSFQFKPELLATDRTRAQHGYYRGTFDPDLKYYVIAESLFKGNFSKSVTKIFKNCTEIQENIPSSGRIQN